MIRDHFNGNVKSRKFKNTKQNYVSWLQSRAMRPRWLEQVRRKEEAREVGKGGRGTRSYWEAFEASVKRDLTFAQKLEVLEGLGHKGDIIYIMFLRVQSSCWGREDIMECTGEWN